MCWGWFSGGWVGAVLNLSYRRCLSPPVSMWMRGGGRGGGRSHEASRDRLLPLLVTSAFNIIEGKVRWVRVNMTQSRVKPCLLRNNPRHPATESRVGDVSNSERGPLESRGGGLSSAHYFGYPKALGGITLPRKEPQDKHLSTYRVFSISGPQLIRAANVFGACWRSNLLEIGHTKPAGSRLILRRSLRQRVAVGCARIRGSRSAYSTPGRRDNVHYGKGIQSIR